jgi:hypothetical protein
MTKRLTLRSIAVLCLAVIAAPLFHSGRTYAGDAAPADWLTGVWVGVVQDDSTFTKYQTTLTVDAAKPDEAMIWLGGPASCRLIMDKVKQDDKSAIFTVRTGSAGKCAKYVGTLAHVASDDSGLNLFLSGLTKTEIKTSRMRGFLELKKTKTK